jgi:predicted  nucleic acid-binding Zn-ribbon protein
MSAPGFDALLALQAIDTAIDQASYRRDTLPERAKRRQYEEAVAAIERTMADVESRRHEMAKAQRTLEDEIAAIVAKATDVDKTLYSGTVRVPRELQALQDELASLGRHQRTLEDRVLEIMEEAEPVDAELASLMAQRDDDAAAARELSAAISEAEAEIDQEIAELRGRRDEALAGVPPPLLAEYEALRPRLDGVAVARLTGATCGGCHLALAAVEVDRIRHLPADAVVHCDECGRILVH